MKILLFIFIILGFQAKANPVEFSGDSVILMEQDSKRVLYGKNIDDVHLTASIAKIMTAIVAIEKGDLDKWCLVDEETINQIGSSIYLTKGDKIKLIDLLYGLMLRSGNDTAHLIAKSVGKDVDDFVLMMNNMAKKLKMTSSVFNNPSGLDDENCNYSTARDMAVLMCYAMQNDIFKTITGSKKHVAKTYEKNVYVFYNKHRLVASGEATGGKTGYTKLAKRTLVTSFKKNGMELVVVTFNCGNDFNIHRSLSNYGFDNYDMVYVFKRGIIDIPEYGITPIIYDDVSYPLSKEEKLYCEIRLLKKPKESIVGIIYLKINNEVVGKFNVYGYYR